MNKKLHLLLFCLAVIFIVYLCKDKLFNLIEPFSQVIITPDNAKLNPKETTFSILTYDSDLGSGVTQASTCSDDSSWKKDDKTCRDYSLAGSNCDDIGDNGKSAFDSCKVACNNCNTYQEIKRRIPSPIEDTDEPPYSQFSDGGNDDDGDEVTMNDDDDDNISPSSGVGGADYREIISRLDDMKDTIGDIGSISSSSTNMVDLRLDRMSSQMRNALSGFDRNNDGILTAQDFLNMQVNSDLLTNASAVGPLQTLIYPQLENTSVQLEELIELFKKNKDLDPPVPDLPTNASGSASYDALKADVTNVKTKMIGFKTGTPPANDLTYINEIYKIVVYLERLDLRLDDLDASKKSTQPNDTYKNKLLNLRDKKQTLLLRLYNDPRPVDRYVKRTHEPIGDSNADIELITNVAKGNGDATPLLSSTTNRVGIPPGSPGDLRLNSDDRYNYLIRVSKSLTGFTFAIVELNDKLIVDIDNAKLIQPRLPPSDKPGDEPEPAPEPAPDTNPKDFTDGGVGTLVVGGGLIASAVLVSTGLLDGIIGGGN